MTGWSQRFLISLLASLVVWSVFTWPLPRHALTGIPSSFAGTEKPAARHMIQGDHLQLLYNYWLFTDMVRGKTPLFHNLYEFNTGNDAERRQVGNYNLPLSLVFAAGYWAGGRALGYNLTILFTLWLTFLATWLLVRRFTRETIMAGMLALFAIIFPYRWANHLGGSPAGLAMAWVPLLLLGVDMAIRDGRWSGGLMAALAILFAFWGDTHVYFFSLLLIPFWCVMIAVYSGRVPWFTFENLRRLALALLPLVVMVLVCVGLSLLQKKAITHAVGAVKRNDAELYLFTPWPRELFAWTSSGIYLGFVAMGAALAALAGMAVALVRAPRRHWRAGVVMGILLLLAYGITLLAVGIRGWDDRELFRFFQHSVPFFGMIRQSAKILCVLPPLIAVFLAIPLGAWLMRRPQWRRELTVMTAVVMLAVLFEYGWRMKPDICLLDRAQGAYQAVAEDATATGLPARALIVPFWPGNSAWTSLCEHYVSLYRIKMMNGYRPVVPVSYTKGIFDVFGSVNIGSLSDAQLDDLLRRGVHYILIHENAFPERISPFPVGLTIDRLNRHPRLQAVSQAESVRAYRIIPAPGAQEVSAGTARSELLFPSIRWEIEQGVLSGGTVCAEPAASGGHYARLGPGGVVSLRPFMHWQAQNGSLFVRVRGGGNVQVKAYSESGTTTGGTITGATDWVWRLVPLDGAGTNRWWRPDIVAEAAGGMDADMAMYVAGDDIAEWRNGITSRLIIPAADMFHAGYSIPRTGQVVLRRDYDPALGIVYGPRWPVRPGLFRVVMNYKTDVPPGGNLGMLKVFGGAALAGQRPVESGHDSVAIDVALTSNLPLEIYFEYNRAADMVIDSFIVEPLSTP